jgi:hypothetical protein
MYKLPASIQDFLSGLKDHSPSHKADLITHCRRELMHNIWSHLMDDDFVTAYKHGVVMRCADGILRRIYPRIFTYSADYPEKYLSHNWSVLHDADFIQSGSFLQRSRKGYVSAPGA